MRTTIERLGPALILALAAWGAGCGGGDPATDAGSADAATGNSCVITGPTVEILDNHRTAGGDHQLTVPAADVIAGVEMTYDIRGDNTGHTHSVTLTAADFTMLRAGTAVTVVSSDNGSAGASHTHTVDFTCP